MWIPPIGQCEVRPAVAEQSLPIEVYGKGDPLFCNTLPDDFMAAASACKNHSFLSLFIQSPETNQSKQAPENRDGETFLMSQEPFGAPSGQRW